MKGHKKISIVGGGIIGQFSAYHLRHSGHEVTIYDDAPLMPSASYGNCGLITPSHILPMNSWSVIWQGLKWLGKRDAPLSIKPQYNPRFISWFLDFALRANDKEIKAASAFRHELLQLSWGLYNEFFEKENPDITFHKDGLLYVCKTKKSLHHVIQESEQLEKYGLPSRLLNSNEISEMEPRVNENIGGAIFDCDGWLDPARLNELVREINISNGVKIVKEDVRLEELDDEVIVLAAGAKSTLLASQIGINLPLIPGKGYNLTSTEIIQDQPTRPIYMFDKKVVFTPWKNGFRIGSTMEFSGYDLSLNPARLEALRTATSEYLDIDLSEVEFTPWAGWRPMTSNSLPIIQRSKKNHKLILATGHGMLGLTLAPATGYLVDCLVNDEIHPLHTSFRH